jgi:hypothetical protein
MTASVSNKKKHPILFLSPMHINERIIKGYKIEDPKMTMRERERKYEENMRKENKKVSDYIYSVMKKLNPNGPHCIMATYHFG